MVKRTSLADVDCPVARALDVIGDWWSLLIIRDAFDGISRFGDFQKSLGISKGILASRLRELVNLGIFMTGPASDDSAYQEYILTIKGDDLFPIVVGLRQWGEAHCFRSTERHSVLVDNASGRPVAPLEVKSRSGRQLRGVDTSVRKVKR